LFIDTILVFISIFGFIQINQKASLPFNLITKHNSLFIQQNNFSHEFTNALLLSINNIEVKNLEDVEFICDGHSIGDKVKISISKNSKEYSIEVVLTNYYSIQYQIILIITAFLFIFFALLILLKPSSNGSVAILLHALIISIFLLMTTTWGSYVIKPSWAGIVVRTFFNFSYALIPIFFLHFTLLFPKAKWNYYRKIIIPLYLVALIIGTVTSFYFISAVNNNSIERFGLYKTSFDICRLFFAVIVLVSVLNFFHSFKYSTAESERRKLRLVLFGTILGPLSFVFLWLLPQTLTSHPLVPEEYILLIVVSIPVTYSIAIKKYQVLDIDLIFNRSTVYVLMMIIVLGLYAGIVAGVAVLIGKVAVLKSMWVSAFAALVIALLFEPIKIRIQKIVDKKFFRIRYNYREAEKEIIPKINFALTIDDVINHLVDEINQLIQPDKIAFYKITDQGKSSLIVSQKNYDENLSNIINTICNKDNTLIQQPIITEDSVENEVKHIPADKALFRQAELSAIFPLLSKSNELIGALFLGKKKSGLPYGIEDVDLINVLIIQTASTIERLELQSTLLLQQAEADRFKELNELKSLFVASVTHDLKTPLTSIKMFAELMEDSPQLPLEKRNEYLKIIQGESLRLGRLIDNVLDIAKIERGIKEYRFEKVNLNNIVNTALQAMEYQIKMNGFEITTDLFNGVLLINADQDAIEEALINIISNSIKYSHQQKEITISTKHCNGEAILSIKDKGIGISEADIERIFKPYERANSGDVKNKQGTGIGLSIVKHIIEGHNAKMKMISELGKGTEFIITFYDDFNRSNL
jgi:signal transduction histidine kinase